MIMIKLIENIKGSYNHIPYTWKHYLAFCKVSKELTGKVVNRFHDWDKLALFILCPWLGERIINQFHQRINKHHPTYSIGKEWKRQLKSPKGINWEEALIDWECARFTKPDKPLNAEETLIKYYPEYINYAKPYLIKLGLKK